jgi:hypothetical protein
MSAIGCWEPIVRRIRMATWILTILRYEISTPSAPNHRITILTTRIGISLQSLDCPRSPLPLSPVPCHHIHLVGVAAC